MSEAAAQPVEPPAQPPSRPPETLVRAPGPSELRDPFVRKEMTRAGVWLAMVAALALLVLLAQPLLMIFGGVVFAAMLDGGVRLLGRVLPISRGMRLLIVVLTAVAFLVGTVALFGVQVTEQVGQLQQTLQAQYARLAGELAKHGIAPAGGNPGHLLQEAAGQLGKLTTVVGATLGALTTVIFILVVGVFFAAEPRIYERGLQWMIPSDRRPSFAVTLERMGGTLRRLLAGRLVGMAVEGVLTMVLLMIGGVPMSLVLGIFAGVFAFIPNIGAFITGALILAVGFSGGLHTGFWGVGVWAVVQAFDGYVVVPIVARRTVDLPPALTFSMQILFSALFGILGLVFADPMTAMLKVALERSAETQSGDPVSDEPVEQR